MRVLIADDDPLVCQSLKTILQADGSEGTMPNYVSAILDKLDLKDRTQLAIFYLRSVE